MKSKGYTELFVLFAIIAILVIPTSTLTKPASAQAVDEPWPMWRHDPAHTGVADAAGPKYLSDPPKWKFKTDFQVDSSPAVANGKVYIGSWDRNIYCLDAQTGDLVWKYTTNAPAISSPAVTGGRVYTGADDGNIYCLNANNGSLIWKYATPGGLIKASAGIDSLEVRSSPCVVGGRVYVGHVDYGVYCLDATTGTKIWNYTAGGMVVSSPAVVGGSVYVGCQDSNLYKLNAADGKFLWKFDCTLNKAYPAEVKRQFNRSGLMASPLVVNNTVYIFSNWGWYLSINVAGTTPTVNWKRFIFRARGNYGSTQSEPIGSWAYRDGKVYLVNQAHLESVDAKTGGILWPELYTSNVTGIPTPGTWEGPGASGGWAEPKNLNQGYLSFIAFSSPAIAGNQIYIGSDSKSVYSFDITTGMKNSWYETDSQVGSSPSIAYGNLYIGSNDFYVYCFSEGQPRDLSWPPTDRPTSAITAALSSEQSEIRVGDWVAISGTITPKPSVHGRSMIYTTVVGPAGQTYEANSMSTTENGSYRITINPDMEGTWKVTAFWYGDTFLQGASSSEMTFEVVAQPASEQPSQPAPSIIPGIADIYLYAVVVVIAILVILVIALVWRARKK